MTDIRRWTWQTWAIVIMAAAIPASWAPDIISAQAKRAELRARLELPTTADLFHVSYVQLDRGPDGHLVVYTDAHAAAAFEGRFKVALRDRDTQRHAWTPEWSEWIDYAANPDGTRYRQPETLQWWSGRDEFFEPPPRTWIMETCWQGRVDDAVLGLVELEPVCASAILDMPRDVPAMTP